MSDNLPAQYERHGKQVAAFIPLDLGDGFVVETTLPQETEKDRALILSVIEGESIRAQDRIGADLLLCHYVIHPINLVDEETGEVEASARTLLLQPNAPPVAFVSKGILESINRIAWMKKMAPPFSPPVPVRLVQQGTGRKRRVYKLVPLEG